MMFAPPPKPRVCLLSPHPLFLCQFEQLLGGSFRLELRQIDIRERAGLQAASIPNSDVYVIDASPMRQHTVAVLSHVLSGHEDAHLLVLAETFSEADAFPLLQAGARGLLTYTEAHQQLARAIREVAQGGFWVPRALLSRFVDFILRSGRNRRAFKGIANLSRREQEVIGCLLQNLSNKEIASRLNISERTAKFHVSNLLAKHGLQRRADLILLCYQTRDLAEPRLASEALPR